MSRHDLTVIQRQVAEARMNGLDPVAVHVSDRRLAAHGLRVVALPVRIRSTLDLNEGLVVCDGREPVSFDFEVTL